MEYSKLEIILHGAKGLYDVKFFGTMDPYAVIWISGDGKCSKKYTTKVATKGASYPVWNCAIEFNFASILHTNYTINFEIKHDGKLIDRDIGEAHVRLKDLVARDDANRKNVSYPVKGPSGDISGEIVISYNFKKLVKSNCTGTSTSTKKVLRKKNIGTAIQIVKAGAEVVSFVFEILDLPTVEFDFEYSDSEYEYDL